MSRTCSKGYKNTVARFFKRSDGVVSRKTVREYLRGYMDHSPKTYNNELCGLRAFVVRFLDRPDLMRGFKKAYEGVNFEVEVPSRRQVKAGFYGLTDDRERAIYLLFASSGLRKSELLRLQKTDVDFKLRCVKAKHFTRTKKAGVTFYNEECAEYIKTYLATRTDSKNRLFRIGNDDYRAIWKKATKAAGCKITPQVLRKWHSTMLGELMVPDRYIDVYQGRAPRTVLAKHYTGKGLERLKRIYERAELKVLA